MKKIMNHSNLQPPAEHPCHILQHISACWGSSWGLLHIQYVNAFLPELAQNGPFALLCLMPEKFIIRGRTLR